MRIIFHTDLPEPPTQAIHRALQQESTRRLDTLRRLTPVRTGRMRSSWRATHATGGKISVLENDAPYSGYVFRKNRPLQVAAMALWELHL
jgi:hypothetical protein